MSVLFFVACIACERTQSAAPEDTAEGASAETEEQTAPPEPTRAVANLQPASKSEVSGTVRFEGSKNGAVQVQVDLEGLEPQTTHAIHIHEKGDCSAPDASSAGGHYDPTNVPHGLPPEPKRHAGDLGNIETDAAGEVRVTKTFESFALGGDSSVIGRAIIIHADRDQGVQPTGDAGERIACGVIQSVGS